MAQNKNSKLKIWQLFLLILLSTHTQAQDTLYARKWIKTLCSKDLGGRGYLNHKMNTASELLANELELLKIKPISANYFQNFSFQVNTFPGRISLKADNKLLEAGKAYYVNPGSGGGKGASKLQYLQAEDILTLNNKGTLGSDKILVLDTLGWNRPDLKTIIYNILENKELDIKGLIFLRTGKMMWSVATSARSYPLWEVDKAYWPSDCKTIKWRIDQKLEPNFEARNIAAFIPGTTDSFIVFSAHYDHLGGMGKDVYFPGANDNASGTTMLLMLASYFAKQSLTPAYNIAFLFFASEEAGLVGSHYFTENPLIPLKKIKYLINLDVIGSGETGITVVNATKNMVLYEKIKRINEESNYLPSVNKRGEAANSDHYFFDKKGVPAVFIYTTGPYSEYHNPLDKAEGLPLTKYMQLFELLKGVVEKP